MSVLLVAAVGVLFMLALTPATADPTATLTERPLPFDVPTSFPHPSTRLVDASAGSNGTAHLLLQTNEPSFQQVPLYLVVNASTGEVLKYYDIRNFSYPSWNQWSCHTLTCGAVREIGGYIVLATPASPNAVYLFFSEPGTFDPTSFRVVGLPPPPSGSRAAELQALALMENASDPSRPSLLWLRYTNVSSYPSYGREIGRIDLDLANRSAGAAYSWGVSASITFANYNTAPDTGWADPWVRSSASRALAGVIDGQGRPWAFFADHNFTGNPAPNQYGGTWFAVTLNGSFEALAQTSNFGLGSVDCSIAADGSVLAFFLSSNVQGAQVAAARGNGTSLGPLDVVPLTDQPTFVVSYLEGASTLVIIGTAYDATPSPAFRIETYSAWPGNLTLLSTTAGPTPVESARMLRGGPSPALAGFALSEPLDGAPSANRSRLANASFGRMWPVILPDARSSASPIVIGEFEDRTLSAFLSVSAATAASGQVLGAFVASVNGTGRLFLFWNESGAARLVRSLPIDVGGSAQQVQVIAWSGSFLVVATVQFPSPTYLYACLCPFYPTRFEYIMFSADVGGNTSRPAPVLSAAGATLDREDKNNFPAAVFRLVPARPSPLLFTSYSILSLDPANRTATQLLNVTSSSIWSPLFFANAAEFAVATASYWESSQPDPLTKSALVFWSSGPDLYAAFPFQSNSLGGFYTSAVFGFRVVRFPPNGPPEWLNHSLAAGSDGDVASQPLSADLLLSNQSAETVQLSLLLRQDFIWERVYEITFNVSSRSYAGIDLLLQLPSQAWGAMGRGLGLRGPETVYLRTQETVDESASNIVINPTAVIVLGTGSLSYAVQATHVTCSSLSIRPCLPSFAIIPWGGNPALLLTFGGRGHFYRTNQPPSPASLRSPPDGSLLNSSAVELLTSNATDPDGDALTYRFIVRNAAGAVAADLLGPDPRAQLSLGDGLYTWTCSVSDGTFAVPCLETFTLFVDTAPPKANAGGPYFLLFGASLSLDGTGSADNHGVLRYDWVIGDGPEALHFTDAGPRPVVVWTSLTSVFAAGGLGAIVRLTVWDAAGHNDTAYSLVTLDFAPPLVYPAMLGPPPREGSSVDLTVNVTWSGWNYTWENPGPFLSNLTVFWTFSDRTSILGPNVSYVPKDSGSVAVIVVVVPVAGPAGRANLTLQVGNIPPSGAVVGPLAPFEGETATYHLVAFDPSPVDNTSLAVEWSVSSNLRMVSIHGMEVTIEALADGSANITAFIRDKDGGGTSAMLPVTVEEVVMPVGRIWIAGNNTTWIDLGWSLTGEEDFMAYEVTVAYAVNGTRVGSPIIISQRQANATRVERLVPGTAYRFTIVVVARANERSAGTNVSGETEPLPTPPPPPRATTDQPVVTSFDALLLGVLLAGAGAVSALVVLQRRRRD